MIDDNVVFQQVWAINHNQQRLDHVINEVDARTRAEEPAPENEWHKLYREWRDWTSKKLADIPNMKTFPCMPKTVLRCKQDACTLRLPNGKKRPLRHIPPCKHDMEMWFRDAAGGYNQRYYEILKYEVDRWIPTQFYGGETELSEKVQLFRNMAGETWKNCIAMTDEYEKSMRGYST
jgi:hypothetical protein